MVFDCNTVCLPKFSSYVILLYQSEMAASQDYAQNKKGRGSELSCSEH